MRVAFIQPGHFGDFILSFPAVRALVERGDEVTLFIAGGNFALARRWFPDLDRRALDLPYLKRGAADANWTGVYATLGELRTFDLAVCMRRDWFFCPRNLADWTDFALFIDDRNDRHQAQLERHALAPVTGAYDIDRLFVGDPMVFPSEPRSIVFSIGAGFPHKKWSPLSWVELAHRLRHRNIDARLFGGPAERRECDMIATAIGLDPRRDVFIGSSDFDASLDWLRASGDLVVAVDGGSAHLCSLALPMLTLFGPSPFRRFAPIGSWNRLLTRDLACSPCVGFDERGLNACMSRECLYLLTPTDVWNSLALTAAAPGETRGVPFSSGVTVHHGSSAVLGASTDG